MQFRDFFSELRRRRVARLAVIYVVVAWIVIQAADTIFPALGIPDWALSLVVVLLILGFPVALVLSWMFDWTPAGVKRSGRSTSVRPRPAKATEERDKSIAVLPFVNLSDDRDNEYFSDGITEEILNALVRVRDLHVASRTSSFAFKGKELDVRDIADQLSVATVLEGSVRKAGTRLRITAQLIDAADGYHLWSHTYDRELSDVFEVQDEIARAIVDALRVELGADAGGPLVAPATHNVEAYNLYLKGRFLFFRFREEDLRRSLQLFGEALDRDPQYGRAYAGIADTWMQLADDWMAPAEAYPEAKSAAQRAIALDDTLAEAHTALGKVLGWFEWDFDAAELALRRAVAANPKYADAHWGLGSILPANGQLEEAIAEMRTTLALDPLSGAFRYWLARFLLFARRYDEAIAEARGAAEMDPTSFRPRLILGQGHLMQGRPEEALAAFREAFAVSNVVSVRAYEAKALAPLGRAEEARAILEELESGAADNYVRREIMASAWAALGDTDRAFAALEQAYQDRSAGLIYLHLDTGYDPLRNDPRYGDLIARIGLRSS